MLNILSNGFQNGVDEVEVECAVTDKVTNLTTDNGKMGLGGLPWTVGGLFISTCRSKSLTLRGGLQSQVGTNIMDL